MKRFVYFAGIYAGSAVLLKAGGFLLSLWMARSLEVADYGDWGLLYAVQTGLATFGLAGIVEAVVGLLRQYASDGERRKLYAAANDVFIITAGIALSLAIAIGLFTYGRNIDILTLAAVLSSGALLAFAALQAQLVRLQERHLASLSFSFIVPAIALVGSAAFFLAQHTPQSFFLGSSIGLIVSIFALQRVGLVGSHRSAEHRSHRREILVRLGPYIAVTLFGWMSGYGNNFVIAGLFENTEVARFTFALSIGAIMQLVASALNQVWSPRFFRITQTESFEVVERKNRQFFLLQSIVLGLISALGMVILPHLLRFIGGNLAYYSSMSIEYFFIFSAYIILTPWWHCHNYFLAYDRGRSVMNIVLVTSAIGVTLWLAFMWLLGPVGIYVGFFTQMVLRTAGIVLFARGQWPVRIGWGGVAAGMLLAAIGLLIAMI